MMRGLGWLSWIVLWAMVRPEAAFGAQSNCPWLNSATASGILGMPVTVTVIGTNKNLDDATCNFLSQGQRGILYTLRIAVTTMSSPAQEFTSLKQQCGSNSTALKGIGNEAIECVLVEKAGLSAEVVGRVRNRAFVVDVSTSARNDPAMTQNAQREKGKRVAEQVSEALY